jgi:hypothetical protein
MDTVIHTRGVSGSSRYWGLALVALLGFFFADQPVRIWASAVSTVELQQDIQVQWREFQGLQAELRNVDSLGDAELVALSEQIEAAKLKIQTSPKKSAANLEAQTLLTEFLFNKSNTILQRVEKKSRLVDQILERITKVEANTEEMQGAFGTRDERELQEMKKTVLAFLDQELASQKLEQQSFVRDLNWVEDPLVKEQLESSKKYLDGAASLVRQMLKAQGQSSSDVYRRQQVVAYKFRGMFETLRARLVNEKSHQEQILRALKSNAELQTAALMVRLMSDSVGDVPGEIEAELDDMGENRSHKQDWQSVRFTEPDTSMLKF